MNNKPPITTMNILETDDSYNGKPLTPNNCLWRAFSPLNSIPSTPVDNIR